MAPSDRSAGTELFGRGVRERVASGRSQKPRRIASSGGYSTRGMKLLAGVITRTGNPGSDTTSRWLAMRNKKTRSCKESHDGATLTQRCGPLASRQLPLIVDSGGANVNTFASQKNWNSSPDATMSGRGTSRGLRRIPRLPALRASCPGGEGDSISRPRPDGERVGVRKSSTPVAAPSSALRAPSPRGGEGDGVRPRQAERALRSQRAVALAPSRRGLG